MLAKLHNGKPVYMKKEEEYVKNVLEPMEEERQRKLSAIKAAHAPLDAE